MDEFPHPTEIQSLAWPAIRQRRHTLIAAPTGSGKTLAAFLAAINDFVVLGLNGTLADRTHIVYVSPLKALSNDIEKNLQRPIEGIREQLKSAGLPDVRIRVMVRTGDTKPSDRTAMTKHPPHILVTTPESLFLLLTSESGRKMLSGVHTVMVDEIHALVRDKRGSHLSLSLERLERVTGRPFVRIGLSATQKPIDEVALFLTGVGDGRNDCAIVNTGHTRRWDLAMEVPRSPLGAVMAMEVWEEVYDRLVQLILEHRTTLVFVNTRKMSERISYQLRERLGAEAVAGHHGSMSKDHRLDAEQRLKAGSLRALVATASLELGIDIGSVDLVCQLGSPKSIATFLQRVGRSGHTIAGTPKGRLFPLSRDELVECAAVMDAVRRGELDRLVIPQKPLDILSQQIVAEVAMEASGESELFDRMRRAYPYRDMTRREFDDIITMLANGFTHRRGRSGAYLHHDAVNQQLRARRGARLAAIMNGGAIPDLFDYDVILEPSNTFIGSLNEDYAIESMAGDVFQLANKSWQIVKIGNGFVRVVDAGEAPPSIPFWLGETPGRTDELSFAVARLRDELSSRFGEADELGGETASDEASIQRRLAPAVAWLKTAIGLGDAAAEQLATYVTLSKIALGAIPTQDQLVMERFFDEAGDMHLVIHSPYGSRINRAWGLSLRKRFCRQFNFELQAAANEDAIMMSLGSTHSFPLDEVYGYLHSKTVRAILVQALFDAPMFESRWRWNAARSLAFLRRRNGKRVPAQLQRMHAQDLVALVFPDQLACLENISGDREVPDHPLVQQTIHDCLTEAMDIEGLERLLTRIENQKIRLIAKDLREPSPMAQEILNARPYAFLDDAPLEERRSRAVAGRSWLDLSEATDLAQLDPAVIRSVQEQAWPEAETADELHEALMWLGFLTESELKRGGWMRLFDELVTSRRATVVETPETRFWIAVEQWPLFKAVYPSAHLTGDVTVPPAYLLREWSSDMALVEIVRGRLEGLGPVTSRDIASAMGLADTAIDAALAALENEGFVFRGQYRPGVSATEWCERRLLARIHRGTLDKLRKEIEPVSAADFLRYLFAWHRMEHGQQPEGPESLAVVLRQLEGYEAPAAAWEGDILPARLADYDYAWLDMACLSGKTAWGRFRAGAGGSGPVKGTPIMLVSRAHLGLWQTLYQNGNAELANPTRQVLEFLRERGASFFDEIVRRTGLLKSHVEESLAELVSAGRVSSDSFAGLRALLVPQKYRSQGQARRHKIPFSMEQAGRWSAVEKTEEQNPEALRELIARTLLHRYGVVFRRLTERENIAPPWRELLRVYRTLEARGEIRGGRFVDGVWGEQYALPEAVTKLRAIRKETPTGQTISISATDPLNLHGVLPQGDKVASLTGNRVLYKDGIVVAVMQGGEIEFMNSVVDSDRWSLQNALVQRRVPPRLKAYLGKGIG